MKRVFLSALLVLAALTCAFADGPFRPISLTKRPPLNPQPPTTRPLSITEDDDFFTVSAEQTDDAILLMASTMAFAQVTIEDENGLVVYCQMEMLGTQPTEIATINWLAGLYLIYIEIGDTEYEGEFEL